MAKLYPPYIEGKIPAQAGGDLYIPFQLNRTMSISDIKNYKITALIKTVSTGLEVGSFDSTDEFTFHPTEPTTLVAKFNISRQTQEENPLKVGTYYKIQLAFKSIEEDTVGYYSTVGVFKYTNSPDVQIYGFELNGINRGAQYLRGMYKPSNEDPLEKEYSYQFNLYLGDELIESSGERIHYYFEREEVDENGYISDYYTLETELKERKYYRLDYIVTTINGLKIVTSYKIYQPSINLQFTMPLNLLAKNNIDSGSAIIYLQSNEPQEFQSRLLRGTFKIFRTSSLSNYEKWEEVYSVLMNTAYDSKQTLFKIYEDFTVQQGVSYKYAVQQYNDTLFTEKMESNLIEIDFEDMFLFDGERQLKLKFDPKVSSFKTTNLEAKIDTIGEKYPFFFRNGNVDYKDFSISGLISCLIDEQKTFTKEVLDDDLGFCTDLVSENIRRERLFKLEVLNWLNDGKLKLFRSPTEGNYIVRLMNISLTPNDSLGRMLHSFNSSAIEAAETNTENLQKYNFIGQKAEFLGSLNIKKQDSTKISIPAIGAVFARIIEGKPNTKVTLVYQNNEQNTIMLGRTGQYNILIEKNNPLINVIPQDTNQSYFKLEFGYEKESRYGIFDLNGKEIINCTYEELCHQLFSEFSLISSDAVHYNVVFLRLQAKEIELVSVKDDDTGIKIYEDAGRQKEKNILLKTSIYQDFDSKFLYAYNGEKVYRVEEEKCFSFSLQPQGGNNESQELKSGRIEYRQKDFNNNFNIQQLILGDGIYADIYYQKFQIVYADEEKGE